MRNPLLIGIMSQPMGIPDGYFAWFDANKITGLSDGDKVAQWNDLSGNDYHAAQGDVTYQPIYKTNIVNGKPVVRFSAHNLVTPEINKAQPNTIFIVWSCYDDPSRAGFVFDGTVSTSRNMLQTALNNIISFFAGTSVTSVANTQPHPFTHLIYRCVYNGAVSSIHRNNSSILSGNVGAQAMGGLTLGSRFAASSGNWFYFNGDIAELIAYDDISAEDIVKVEKYLANKYNITLAL